MLKSAAGGVMERGEIPHAMRETLTSVLHQNFGAFNTGTSSSIGMQETHDTLRRHLVELKSKSSEGRARAARAIHQFLEEEYRERSGESFAAMLNSLMVRIQEYGSSHEVHEKLGCVLLIDELLDLAMESETMVIRFANQLSILIKEQADLKTVGNMDVLDAATHALGHLARSSAPGLTSDFLEHELGVAIKSLTMDRQTEMRRHAALMIVTELAQNAPALFYSHVMRDKEGRPGAKATLATFFERVWLVLSDNKIQVRVRAALALRAVLRLVAQRSTGKQKKSHEVVYLHARKAFPPAGSGWATKKAAKLPIPVLPPKSNTKSAAELIPSSSSFRAAASGDTAETDPFHPKHTVPSPSPGLGLESVQPEDLGGPISGAGGTGNNNNNAVSDFDPTSTSPESYNYDPSRITLLHGALLTLYELLDPVTGNFMEPHFFEVLNDCVMRDEVKTHKDVLIVHHVVALLSRLAQFCPSEMVTTYLQTCCKYLFDIIKKADTKRDIVEASNDRAVAFRALGQLSEVPRVGKKFLSHVPAVLDAVHALVTPKQHRGSNRNGGIFCDEALECLTVVIRSQGLSKELIDTKVFQIIPFLMNESDLSEALVGVLAELGRADPVRILPNVRKLLLHKITGVLGKAGNYRGGGGGISGFGGVHAHPSQSLSSSSATTLQQSGDGTNDNDANSTSSSTSSFRYLPHLFSTNKDEFTVMSRNLEQKLGLGSFSNDPHLVAALQGTMDGGTPPHPSAMAVAEATSQKSLITKRRNSTRTIAEQIDTYRQRLALRTLGEFDFSGYNMLSVLNSAVVQFLESPNVGVRDAAVVSCCHLVLSSVLDGPTVSEEQQKKYRIATQHVVERLVVMAMTDSDADIRRRVVEELDSPRFRRFMLENPENLRSLFILVNDQHFNVRSAAVSAIGHITTLAPSYVMPALRTVMVRLMTELDFGGDLRHREESATLLGFLVQSLDPPLARPHVKAMLAGLLPKLNDPNQGVAASMMATLGEVSLVAQDSLLPSVLNILKVIVTTLQDHRGHGANNKLKREVALATLSKVARSTILSVWPYFYHRRLLNLILHVMLSSTTSSAFALRRQAMIALGTLGALDPWFHKKNEMYLEWGVEGLNGGEDDVDLAEERFRNAFGGAYVDSDEEDEFESAESNNVGVVAAATATLPTLSDGSAAMQLQQANHSYWLLANGGGNGSDGGGGGVLGEGDPEDAVGADLDVVLQPMPLSNPPFKSSLNSPRASLLGTPMMTAVAGGGGGGGFSTTMALASAGTRRESGLRKSTMQGQGDDVGGSGGGGGGGATRQGDRIRRSSIRLSNAIVPQAPAVGESNNTSLAVDAARRRSAEGDKKVSLMMEPFKLGLATTTTTGLTGGDDPSAPKKQKSQRRILDSRYKLRGTGGTGTGNGGTGNGGSNTSGSGVTPLLFTDLAISQSSSSYYSLFATSALVRVLMEPAAVAHRRTTIQALMKMFTVLRLNSVILLPHAVPALLHVANVQLSNTSLTPAERTFPLADIGKLISLVGGHFRPYLPELIEVTRPWFSDPASIREILLLTHKIADSLEPKSLQLYVPNLLPEMLGILISERDNPDMGWRNTNAVLDTISKLGSALGDYLNLVLPVLMRLIDHSLTAVGAVRLDIKVKAVETLSVLVQKCDVADYSSRVLHPLVRALHDCNLEVPFLPQLVDFNANGMSDGTSGAGGGGGGGGGGGAAMVMAMSSTGNLVNTIPSANSVGGGGTGGGRSGDVASSTNGNQRGHGESRAQAQAREINGRHLFVAIIDALTSLIFRLEEEFAIYIPMIDRALSHILQSIKSSSSSGGGGNMPGEIKLGAEEYDRVEFFKSLVGRVLRGQALPKPLWYNSRMEDKPSTEELSDLPLPTVEEPKHQFRLGQITKLKKAWETQGRTTEDDWNGWFRVFSLELLRESPSPALAACAPLAQVYETLAHELFHCAFAAVWNVLSDTAQSTSTTATTSLDNKNGAANKRELNILVENLEAAIKSSNVPQEILQTLLNLAEFMEHDDKPLPLSMSALGDLAMRIQAYAKALHYKEMEFRSSPADTVTIENLIRINKNLDQLNAAMGVVDYARKNLYVSGGSTLEFQPSWYAQLGRWDDALKEYRRKADDFANVGLNPSVLGLSKEEMDVSNGTLLCLKALGEWDRMASFALERRNEISDMRRAAGKKAQSTGVAAGISTSGGGGGGGDDDELFIDDYHSVTSDAISVRQRGDGGADRVRPVSALMRSVSRQQSTQGFGVSTAPNGTNTGSGDESPMILRRTSQVLSQPPRRSPSQASLSSPLDLPMSSRQSVDFGSGIDGLAGSDERYGHTLDHYDQVSGPVRAYLQQLATHGAYANWILGQWGAMATYVKQTSETSYDGSFLRAVLAIHTNDMMRAEKYVESAYRVLGDVLSSQLSESYSRAYPRIIQVQELAELQEIIGYKYTQQSRSPEEVMREKSRLKMLWRQRLQGVQQNVDVLLPILAVRSMVVEPFEDIDTWLNFAKVARKQNRKMLSLKALMNLGIGHHFHGARNSGAGGRRNEDADSDNEDGHIALIRLDTPDSMGTTGSGKLSPLFPQGKFAPEGSLHPRVAFAYVKHLWSFATDTKQSEEAIKRLKKLTEQLNASLGDLELDKGPMDELARFSEAGTQQQFAGASASTSNAPSQQPRAPINTTTTTTTPTTTSSSEATEMPRRPSQTPRRGSAPIRASKLASAAVSAPGSSSEEEDSAVDHKVSDGDSDSDTDREATGKRTATNKIPTATPLRSGLQHAPRTGAAAVAAAPKRSLVAKDIGLEDVESVVEDSTDGHVSPMVERLKSLSVSQRVLLAVRCNCKLGEWILHQNTSQDDQKKTQTSKMTLERMPALQGTNKDMIRSGVRGDLENSYPSFYKGAGVNNQVLFESTITEVLGYYDTAIRLDPTSYKAWRLWALANFQAAEVESVASTNSTAKKNGPSRAVCAVYGLFKSITLGSKEGASVLQDVLRLLQLWFLNDRVKDDGKPVDKDVATALERGIQSVKTDKWLEVIPQLIARVNKPGDLVSHLLGLIGNDHPQQLLYPLTVASNSNEQNPQRSVAAQIIMEKLAFQHRGLVNEARIVSRELIRVAVLWNEMWHEGLEDASRFYYSQTKERDIPEMLATLEALHERVESGPQTLSEVGFAHAFGSRLREAYEWLQAYKATKDLAHLNQAWNLYYHVFIALSSQLDVKTLELRQVSPQLLHANKLQLAVPGTYQNGLVRIDGFAPDVRVIKSKQRPRVVTMHGSDGADHMFLLKGHEDLRLDERVMQLLNLVNALLMGDPETHRSDVEIHSYAVVPLSHRAGIMQWVPNCDTLHELVKGYREARKIPTLVEHLIIAEESPANTDTLTATQKVEVFEQVLKQTSGQDVARVLWLKSRDSETWIERRTNYTRSLAAMSIVGYILGLGDRHPSNLMMERSSGRILHIDFGDCFEVTMTREKQPECVPFRLTRMLVNAMEASGIEGNYRTTCEAVMRVLRVNRDPIMTMLSAFLHDPLITWRLLRERPISGGGADDGDAAAGGGGGGVAPSPGSGGGGGNRSGMESTTLRGVEGMNSRRDNTFIGSLIDGSMRASMAVSVKQADIRNSTTNNAESNEKAVEVTKRVKNKLRGTDFNVQLPVKDQVDRLIRQATCKENLAVLYMGWCAYW